MIRVILAEDHDLVRQGMKALLLAQPDIKVIGEARNGHEAVENTEKLFPDLLILDLNMPYMNGIETIKQIRRLGERVKILVLTMYSDEALIKRSFRNGANGFLLKNSSTNDMIQAIRSVYHGEYYLSPELEAKYPLDEILASGDETDQSEQLTTREREICQLITQGKTNQSIAHELKISVKTVEKHRANLMTKLGAADVAGLIRIAIQKGLIVLESKHV